MTQPGTLFVPEVVVNGIPAISLFSRASVITIGTVQISNIGQQLGLDVWFSVRRTLKAGTPNTCDLKIWNLSNSSRFAIESSSQSVSTSIANIAAAPGAPDTGVPVKIEAGYVGNMSTIFLGNMRSAQTVRDGEDLVTEIQTGDGDDAMQVARVNEHSGPTNAYAVAQKLLTAMGFPTSNTGNLNAVKSVMQASTLYQQGVLLKGNPADMMIDLCKSIGLEFSIQSNQPQFLSLGEPLAGSGYEFSSATGLIGNPSVDTKGILTCVVLMVPGLKPGDPISMDAEFVTGNYRIESITTVGDSAGNDWCHRIEARKLGVATPAKKAKHSRRG
jgi:hypothetical protein